MRSAVACCGESGGISCRREVAQRGMRPSPVVIVDPVRDLGPGMIEAEDQALVEKLGLRNSKRTNSLHRMLMWNDKIAFFAVGTYSEH